jgi:hypothetical protein
MDKDLKKLTIGEVLEKSKLDSVCFKYSNEGLDLIAFKDIDCAESSAQQLIDSVNEFTKYI